MTEHLDGSYPTSKFRENKKPWVMDRKMLMPVILSLDIYHNGRERLFIVRLGPRKPGSDNGDWHTPFSFLFVLRIIHKRIEMDLKELGERLRMIRKHLRINQQQLAKATNLTQPAISRLENGEEVYASALLAVLDFYRERVSLDFLLDPDLDTDDKSLFFCSQHEVRQRLDSQLTAIAHHLDESLEQIATLKDQI